MCRKFFPLALAYATRWFNSSQLSVELAACTSERQTNQVELDVSELEAHIVEKNNGCMVLFGMREGKRSLGTSGCRWEENTKFAVQAVRREIVD